MTGAATPEPAAPRPAAPELAAGPARRRNGPATRAAILESAVAAFTRAGYDGVGVREIAGDAGVTAMLVNRYFGSKEQLFAEAVDAAFTPRTVVGSDPATISEDIAQTLAARTAPGADVLDPFMLMLHSAGNPRAARIIRDGIEAHVGRDLAGLLPGPDAGERAELVLSLIAGVWLIRKVIATTALSTMDTPILARQLRDLIDLIAAPSGERDAGSKLYQGY
jgi:AcrR family transcriptional regulator